MTFGQILDRIFRLMRSHWKPFMGIGILPIGVIFAFEAVFFGAMFLAGAFRQPPAPPNLAMLWPILPLGLLFLPVMLLVYGLYYGASAYASVHADFELPFTVREALGHAWSRIGRYVWLMVLKGLILAIPILVCVAAALGGALLFGLVPNGNPSPAALFFLVPLAVLLYLGGIVYAVIMTMRLSLAYPASAHENLTAMQAVKRSGVLTQGAKGRIFLMLLVIYAIGYAVAMVFYVIGLFVVAIGAVAGASLFHAWTPLTITLAALAGLVFIALVFAWALLLMAAYNVTFAVFYRDQRLRKDKLPSAPTNAGALA
jgi:hypothetical protein